MEGVVTGVNTGTEALTHHHYGDIEENIWELLSNDKRPFDGKIGDAPAVMLTQRVT